MKTLRFVLVIFLCHIIFIECWKTSKPGDKVIIVSDAESANMEDEDVPPEHVDCSEVSSTLGRAVKWVFVANSRSNTVPNVRFFLSSRIQRTRVEVKLGNEFRLNATDFKADRRTVLIVHGFKSGGFKEWVQQMETALLLWGDVNVVVVDWSQGAKKINYYSAAVNTVAVGYKVARFLHHLVNATIAANGLNSSNWGPLHVVGHSLGAHVSGVAAVNFMHMQEEWRVTRITGLDPANLCFRNVDLALRLDHTDADFVDVIHTSANSKSTTGFGIYEPIGHADFYANGGMDQPGCTKRQGWIWKYIPVPRTAIEAARCSHQRAYYYFTESVVAAAKKNCSFWAHPWNPSDSDTSRLSKETCNTGKCTEMGIKSESYHQRGTFYVRTSGTIPYCIKSPSK